ncbi:HAD family hydrolase [Spiroplasma eriocheiris]|uniref:HAD family hydrolase n=1 Tax=Spiroplasma eriocheiris TaxID=315358 RepID=A0A0H3XIE2_9MOLU|nr:HAD family hydrolase [Spiroplasma eriocheiris]AHF57782.1 putative HAD superfamily hydrolase [Spiroplasma eriocheiris CCTCC M 207170]AKM54230.1 HAD family hydrolase [Spiroplasma eriocheiris]
MSLIAKYPYIITDLDGTITRKDFTISDKTYEALRMYQLASDYKLILASGRLDLMTKEYADKLQIKMPIISCNGALIRDSITHEILFQRTLDQHIALAILTAGVNQGLNPVIYTANMIYGPEKADRIQMVLNYNKTATKPEYQIEVDTTSDFVELVRQNKIHPLKILFSFDSPEKLAKIKKITDKFSEHLECVFSQKDLYDIQALNISKGSAFKILCDIKGYNPIQFISYGDNHNDIKLAQSVGYPVAMGNGVSELKEIAKEVTLDINADGVAYHVINKVLVPDDLSQLFIEVKNKKWD